jgi:flagellar motor switch protein FliN/FliY
MTDELDPKPTAASDIPDVDAGADADVEAGGSGLPEGVDVSVAGNEDEPDAGASEGVVDDLEAEAEKDMLAMLESLPDDDSKPSADDINFDNTSASRAEFQQLQQPVTPPEARNIELLMDVDLPISIELGRTKMSISEILGLGPGSVVELNKLAGEPVDLLVNYKVVARGEVVVVDENFGLRITQLMTPEERLKALAED